MSPLSILAWIAGVAIPLGLAVWFAVVCMGRPPKSPIDPSIPSEDHPLRRAQQDAREGPIG